MAVCHAYLSPVVGHETPHTHPNSLQFHICGQSFDASCYNILRTSFTRGRNTFYKLNYELVSLNHSEIVCTLSFLYTRVLLRLHRRSLLCKILTQISFKIRSVVISSYPKAVDMTLSVVMNVCPQDIHDNLGQMYPADVTPPPPPEKKIKKKKHTKNNDKEHKKIASHDKMTSYTIYMYLWHTHVHYD